MKVLNLLTGGKIGGIETLCYNWGINADFTNGFVITSEPGPVSEEMRSSGMTLYDFSCLPKLSIRKLYRLKKLSKEYDIIIVHHEDPFLKLYFILLSLFTKCKMITYVHSCYGDYSQINYGRVKTFLYKKITQKAFDVSDAVISVSKAGEESFRTVYRVNKEKCYVVYNGISKSIFEKGKNNVPIFDGEVMLLYVGRLSKIKGVDLLIRAVNRLKQYDKLHLDIVGTGDEERHLKLLTNEFGLDNKITFHGAQTDVTPYLQKANIFVYPSVCQEVFGISIIEAMSFGIPCVANKVGGIPEIIEDGKNGKMTSEQSPESIAKCIEEFVQRLNKGELSSISAYAKETAAKFTIQNNCTQVNNVLQLLLRN